MEVASPKRYSSPSWEEPMPRLVQPNEDKGQGELGDAGGDISPQESVQEGPAPPAEAPTAMIQEEEGLILPPVPNPPDRVVVNPDESSAPISRAMIQPEGKKGSGPTVGAVS